MIGVFKHPVSIMVMSAVALHILWSVLLVIDPAAMGATAINSLSRYIGAPVTVAASTLTAALLAVVAVFTRVPWIVVLLLPQQILLMMSAAGAVEAIWLGQFADGVTRARAFIAADQAYSILVAIGHTIAIVAHARRVVVP